MIAANLANAVRESNETPKHLSAELKAGDKPVLRQQTLVPLEQSVQACKQGYSRQDLLKREFPRQGPSQPEFKHPCVKSVPRHLHGNSLVKVDPATMGHSAEALEEAQVISAQVEAPIAEAITNGSA